MFFLTRGSTCKPTNAKTIIEQTRNTFSLEEITRISLIFTFKVWFIFHFHIERELVVGKNRLSWFSTTYNVINFHNSIFFHIFFIVHRSFIQLMVTTAIYYRKSWPTMVIQITGRGWGIIKLYNPLMNQLITLRAGVVSFLNTT